MLTVVHDRILFCGGNSSLIKGNNVISWCWHLICVVGPMSILFDVNELYGQILNKLVNK